MFTIKFPFYLYLYLLCKNVLVYYKSGKMISDFCHTLFLWFDSQLFFLEIIVMTFIPECDADLMR